MNVKLENSPRMPFSSIYTYWNYWIGRVISFHSLILMGMMRTILGGNDQGNEGMEDSVSDFIIMMVPSLPSHVVEFPVIVPSVYKY